MIAFQNLTSLQLLSLLEIEPCLQPKPPQIKHIGGVLESSWRAVFKTALGYPIWPRFKGENGKSKCPFSYDFYCKFISIFSEIEPCL